MIFPVSDIGAVSVSNVLNDVSSSINNVKPVTSGSGFGYKLKRSMTVSHILDNINKSFRVRRSSSQREVAAKKTKFKR